MFVDCESLEIVNDTSIFMVAWYNSESLVSYTIVRSDLV